MARRVDESPEGVDALGERLAVLSPRQRAVLDTLLRPDSGPSGTERQDLARRLAALPPEGRAALLARRRGLASVGRELRRREPGVPVPLSYPQERLWFLDQYLPGNPAYNETNSMPLDFPVNVGLFRRAVNEIIRRHEALRMTVGLIDGRAHQRVAPELDLDVPLLDLTRLGPDERQPEASRLAAEQSRAPFDLEAGPLVRASLIRLDENEYRFVLTMHHIVCDGWSMGVFMIELVALYWSFVAGRDSPFPELEVQYGDYAIWQRARSSPSAIDGDLAYWRTQLADLPTLQLPTDRPRPARFSFNGARCPVEISESTGASLTSLAEREGVTLFMVVLAAWAVLLHRYTEQSDVVVGTPSAGRSHGQLEPLIGLFVNTLVLRVNVADGATFQDVLAEVRRTAVEAYAHEDVPFDLIVEALKPARDPSRNPLFQVMFQLFRPPSATGLRTDVLIPFEPVESGIAKTDLTLNLIWTERGIRGHLEYCTDLFDTPRIERMVAHFLRVLEAAVASPEAAVADYDILTPAERTQLVAWNQTTAPYPRDRTIPELFATQAARTPEATALRFADQEMTYAELSDRAAAIAAELVARGVRPGDLVAVYGERGLEWPAAALGVLEAGAAYVPIDPAYPAERVSYMLRDSGAAAVVSTGNDTQAMGGFDGPIITVHDVGPGTAPPATVAGDSAALAYVMYTSGTTGQPKGVAVTHRNVLRLVMDVGYVELGDTQVMLQFAPVSFDASTFEVWGCLLHGGMLAIHPPGVPSLEELGAFIRRERITIAFLTTALFAQMIEQRAGDLRNVGQLITGGEQLFQSTAAAAWKALPRSRVLHAYGPTECTTFATMYRIGRPDTLRDPVPIGRPIENTTAHVLDRRGQPAPVGVPGELWLGGDGVAAGYWQRPELTSERFVPDPFRAGGSLYRTGDVACFRDDGELLFLGRRDRQVKVNGYRVELGEVEAAIHAHPGVRSAVVVAIGTADKSLAAFYDGGEGDGPATDVIRAHLLLQLPRHMVPARLERVDGLPLTPNGKVDVARLLRETSGERGEEAGYVEPRAAVEHQLAAIWGELLDVQRVGVRDNFFEHGGHSLVATRLLSRIRATFNREVTMRSFFDAPTIEGLARLLD